MAGLPGALGIPVLFHVGEASKSGSALAPTPLRLTVESLAVARAWSRELATNNIAPSLAEENQMEITRILTTAMGS